MIDNDLFIGNNITGNFRPKTDITEDIHKYQIEKADGVLYLVNERESIELVPVNDCDAFVVRAFSDEPPETNESIYRLEMNKGIVILLLYTYIRTEKIAEFQKIRIHLSREAENQICGEGYNGLNVNSKADIIPLLRKLFINNRSVFVNKGKNKNRKKKTNDLQIHGEKFYANLVKEKPGVYLIEKIGRHNKNYSFDVTQIYGDIDFLLWDDAIGFKGNDVLLQNIKTNEIFDAWEEYMDFEKKIYENDLKDFGIINYENIEADGDKLIFNLTPCGKISWEKIRNVEFEYMSAYSKEEVRILPKTADEVLREKETQNNSAFYVGKPINDDFDGNKLCFDSSCCRFFDIEHKDAEGILYVSNHGLLIEQRRRNKVLEKIASRTNETANIIMKLSEESVEDRQKGTSYDPVNPKVLKKMFGDSTVQLKEAYKKAMSIALNTPDIALIQGPPGTGKTTLIRGLIARINNNGEKYKILVSSEQHEALFNIVDKLSKNKLIPPFVSSRRFDSDTDEKDSITFEKNVKELQESFLNVCRDILEEIKQKDSKADLITEFTYIILDIKDNNCSKFYISTVIDQLKEKIIDLGLYEKVENELLELYKLIDNSYITENEEEQDSITKFIIRKINAQRTTSESFFDDGARQLKDLQDVLRRKNYNDLLLPDEIYNTLQSGNKDEINKIFNEYTVYVETIKDKFIPKRNEFENEEISCKDLINSINSKVQKAIKEKPKDFYGIVETLMYRLHDIDAVSDVIKNYTSVIGSTCAQAEKSIDIANLQNDKYDYIIIDEAARANPLDIMIPMMMGTKVILIGDHMQLPHYIESNYVRKFKNEKEKYSEFNEKLLTKSLFQIIYENLENAFKDGRLNYKRTGLIEEQHRMHPDIGDFISGEFYGGKIKNGEKTKDNINDYGVFNGKHVVWLNVDLFKGKEERVNQSFRRQAEADKIIELLNDFKKKNPDRKLDIGIISFYKEQVKLINELLEKEFSKINLADNNINISCNTVDSYQGKEFDIVILSGVRSNSNMTVQDKLGFIHYSPSRINVALSRAKRLLIVVADADTYHVDEHFAKFIEHTKKVGYYER